MVPVPLGRIPYPPFLIRRIRRCLSERFNMSRAKSFQNAIQHLWTMKTRFLLRMLCECGMAFETSTTICEDYWMSIGWTETRCRPRAILSREWASPNITSLWICRCQTCGLRALAVMVCLGIHLAGHQIVCLKLSMLINGFQSILDPDPHITSLENEFRVRNGCIHTWWWSQWTADAE